MERFFTVLEGEGKGLRKPLVLPRMLIGRSRDADLQIVDPLVSRGHLEVRVDQVDKAQVVFVKNLSVKGSLLNGTRLEGEVSLSPGDVLEIGHTKLCYNEAADAAPPPETPKPVEEPSFEIDGTLAAAPENSLQPAPDSQADIEADSGHTRAFDDGRTMVQPGNKLPGPKQRPPKEHRRQHARALLIGACLATLLLAAGGAAWLLYARDSKPAAGTIEFKDSLYDFAVEYPADWSKTTDPSDAIVFRFGSEGSGDWGRVSIYPEKKAEHALTGLTEGFVSYQDVLKKRYKDFQLIGKERRRVNEVNVVVFRFRTSAIRGVGIYVLNSETRIVLECTSPETCYKKYLSAGFDPILGSFRLTTGEAQDIIDFPLPDEGMRELALSNPAELSSEVEEHIRQGEALMAAREVRPDNLYRAVQECRAALQLSVAGPQRVPGYASAAQGLRQATRLYNQALESQRFELNHALNQRDRRTAYWAAHKMMQMVPDKVDPAYQEASKIARSLQTPEGAPR